MVMKRSCMHCHRDFVDARSIWRGTGFILPHTFFTIQSFGEVLWIFYGFGLHIVLATTWWFGKSGVTSFSLHNRWLSIRWFVRRESCGYSSPMLTTVIFLCRRCARCVGNLCVRDMLHWTPMGARRGIRELLELVALCAPCMEIGSWDMQVILVRQTVCVQSW